MSTNFLGAKMDPEEKKEDKSDVGQAIKAAMSDPSYWARRRARWDEWGSPVGLTLGWALFIIPLGLFLWLLHLANILR